MGDQTAAPGLAVGARYRHLDAPNVTWEVISLYIGVDQKQHAVLGSIADATWRKIISVIELEQSGHYAQVATL